MEELEKVKIENLDQLYGGAYGELFKKNTDYCASEKFNQKQDDFRDDFRKSLFNNAYTSINDEKYIIIQENTIQCNQKLIENTNTQKYKSFSNPINKRNNGNEKYINNIIKAKLAAI